MTRSGFADNAQDEKEFLHKASAAIFQTAFHWHDAPSNALMLHAIRALSELYPRFIPVFAQAWAAFVKKSVLAKVGGLRRSHDLLKMVRWLATLLLAAKPSDIEASSLQAVAALIHSLVLRDRAWRKDCTLCWICNPASLSSSLVG